MARIRSLKPVIWESEKVGRMSALSRLNFIGLISLADDHGRGLHAPPGVSAKPSGGAFFLSVRGARATPPGLDAPSPARVT